MQISPMAAPRTKAPFGSRAVLSDHNSSLGGLAPQYRVYRAERKDSSRSARPIESLPPGHFCNALPEHCAQTPLQVTLDRRRLESRRQHRVGPGRWMRDSHEPLARGRNQRAIASLLGYSVRFRRSASYSRHKERERRQGR
jgi:hypothetical protein